MSDLAHRLSNLSPERRALLEKQLAAKAAAERAAADEQAVAAIGLGCRFPGGASSPEALWQLLLDGVDAVREVPSDRWDAGANYDRDITVPGRTNTKWGGFLDERLDELDAPFFGISPREARQLDPQQR